jgi:Rod binding domain-containing protein
MWKPINSLPPELRTRETAEREQVTRVARDFASFFFAQVIRTQRATVESNELFGGGSAEQTFTSMLDHEYANRMAAADTGLSEMIERQLARRMYGLASHEARTHGAKP